MVRILSILVILFFTLIQAEAYVSKFLDIPTNSMEYQVLLEPDRFPLKTGALLAAGVSEQNLLSYLSIINEFEASVKPETSGKSFQEVSKILFEKMHQQFLKKYGESDTTLDVVLKWGKFNCLSSTMLYSSLLEDFGYPYLAVAVPTHIYTMLNIDGRDVDVENTSPNGYDIGTNLAAQENFKKLTGYTYTRNSPLSEIADKKSILAYNYGNIAYFASKLGQPESAFQNALKAWAINPNGKYIYTNVVAAYSQYILYLADRKEDFPKALSILEEALEYLPRKDIFLSNYYYTLDKYLIKLVDKGSNIEALQIMDNSMKTVGRNLVVEDNLYLRVMKRLITRDRDFEQAYQFGKKAYIARPDSVNMLNILLNGMQELAQRNVQYWERYPEGEKLILDWHALLPKKSADDILEYYYSRLSTKYFEAGRFEEGVALLDKAAGILSYTKNLQGLLMNGVMDLVKKKPAEWESFKVLEEIVVRMSDSLAKKTGDTKSGATLLEVFYQESSLRFYEAGQPDKAIDIMRRAIIKLPDTVVIRKNLAIVANNTALAYFKKEDYKTGLKYINTALDADPKSADLIETKKSAYRVMAYNEIKANNFRKASAIVEEGLKLFPADPKLLYYKDYIRKGGK